tara:strand:+ start:89 stop:553 length:465 start_codon:yes stop_codon:yes gene_type:complete
MIFSIQILDFNEDNSSESFLKTMTPTDVDIQTYGNFYNLHEEYLEDENEDNDMFGFLELDVKIDIENMSDTQTAERYVKAEKDCGIFYLNSFVLNKTNSESFEFILNMFEEFGNADFIDENFSIIDIDELKEKVKEKQRKSIPVVLNYFFYILE